MTASAITAPSCTSRLRIRDVRATVVHAGRHSNWVFVHVETGEGLSGIGEATLDGHETLVLGSLSLLRSRFLGRPVDDIERACAPMPGAPGGLAFAAALSGIEQALWDLRGQEFGVPVYALFGGASRPSIRAYANINRAIQPERRPEDFARAAEAAVRDGFTAIKCAPFDELFWEPLEEESGRALIARGLERVRAVKDAVSKDVALIIDCHFRFDARTAARVIPALEEFEPYWIEAPVPERDTEAWAKVRASTRARLGGGELLIGLAAHRRFIEASGVDVVMPDVKYAGGIATLRKVAALAEADGLVVAPHNPSGPVATLSSLHAIAATPNAIILEYAWGEVGWRSELVGGAEHLEGGALVLPETPGLGIRFDAELARAHPAESTVLTLDLRLW